MKIDQEATLADGLLPRPLVTIYTVELDVENTNKQSDTNGETSRFGYNKYKQFWITTSRKQ